MGVGIGILPELEEIFVSGEKSFERTLCSSNFQDESGDPGRDDRHHAVAGQFVYE